MQERTYTIRRSEEGSWEIWRDGDDAPSLLADSESEALDMARELASRHPPSRLVLLTDGRGSRVAREWSRPLDPAPVEGGAP